MANDLLNPTEAETGTPSSALTGAPSSSSESSRTNLPASSIPAETGHELDAFLGKAFEEKSVFADLYDNIHDLFFPTKLPPLELTSKPVAVVDPMAVKRSPVAVAISIGINVGIVLILLFAFRKEIVRVVTNGTHITNIDANIKPYLPQTPKSGPKMGGGGGGGSHDIVDPIKGRTPKTSPNPILQPQVAVNPKPRLAVEPTINVPQNVKLPDNPDLPNLGALNSKNNVVYSNGQGTGGGIGTHSGGGVGPGNGSGYGPGSDHGVGGGLFKVGNGVSAPTPIFQPEAEFSDEARRAKYEGTVVVSLIVDAQGNPQNVHVARSLGMGLDEKAMEAVRQYKFKPAYDSASKKNVPVPINVEVRFRLY